MVRHGVPAVMLRQERSSAARLLSSAAAVPGLWPSTQHKFRRNISGDMLSSTYLLVLPVVPRVRAAAVTHDAPTSRGRAQVVRRLLRQMRADCRSADRRSADGGDLPGCARRLQLHLRRGDMGADVAGLDRGACAHVPLLWRGTATVGSRQPQERHQQSLVLRPRGEPQLRGDGGALQRGRPASPAKAPARQSCGRGRGQIRAVIHHRPASSAGCATSLSSP